jgi:hypothetical protein
MTVVSVSTWERLTPEHAPSAVFAPPVCAMLTTGEFLQLKNPILFANLEFLFCKVLKASSQPCQLQVQLILLAAHLGSVITDQINHPSGRAYMEYPKEVVLTNFVATLDVEQVKSEIFLLTANDIESSMMGVAVGMSNSYCIRFKWDGVTNALSSVGDSIKAFPSGRDTFSKRAWCFVSRCHDAISRALNRGALNQNLTATHVIPCSEEDWEYLKRRMIGVPLFVRPGFTSFVRTFRNGTREKLKVRASKEIMRIDTDEKLDVLKQVVGPTCFVGFRKRPPLAPKLTSRDDYAFSTGRLHHYDVINIVGDLSSRNDAEPGIYVPYPKSRGVDLKYFDVEGRLRISVRYNSHGATDPEVRQIVSVSQSESQQNNDAQTDVNVSVGTEFEHDLVLYRIVGIDGHIINCTAIESENISVEVGDNVEFTKDLATEYVIKYLGY